MAFLENELKQLQEKFIASIKMFDNLTMEEKISLAYQMDVFQELQSLGLSDIVDDLTNEYAGILARLSDLVPKGVAPLSLQDIALIAELDAETLLGKAEAYAKEFKSSLIKGFIIGEDTAAIQQRLGDINLASNQTIAAINTARDEFNATATAKLFEDEPETRFKLTDFPLDEKTRDSCRAVIEFQPNEGWTKEEIDNGAVSQLVRSVVDDFEGDYSFIKRGGYNCRHQWEIV